MRRARQPLAGKSAGSKEESASLQPFDAKKGAARLVLLPVLRAQLRQSSWTVRTMARAAGCFRSVAVLVQTLQFWNIFVGENN
jgi:hypothetical protein